MQQGDGVLAHRLVYLVIGAALLVTQHGRLFEHIAQFGKPVDFFLVDFQHPSPHGLVQHSAAHAGALQQVVFAHFPDVTTLEPSRHVQVGQQQRFLLGSPFQLIEELMQPFLVITR